MRVPAGLIPPSASNLIPGAITAWGKDKDFAMSTAQQDAGFSIAERTTGSRRQLALLRWSLVVIFLWFGGMKFTAYEANGIAPLIAHSPIMSWLHAVFGIEGAARVVGLAELATAVALALGAFVRPVSALGAAMSTLTFLTTLSFMVTTPGVAAATAGGFPAISGDIGQFLLKDLVLLAASLCLLSASVPASWPRSAT